MNPTSNALRITPRLIVGLGILTLGVLWTLDNLDIIESSAITDWWPLIVILAGVVRFLDPRANRLASVLIAAVGVLLLLDTLDYADIDFGDLIPIGIALLGAKLVWDALARRQARRDIEGGDPSSVINAFAMLSGVKRQVTATDFRGGDATAVMGGVEIDLSHAQIPAGKEAVIDAFALWGAVEITVPLNWRVVGDVMPIMGGFEDATVSTAADGPVLIIRGAAIMGAIEVKTAKHAPASR
ncbi:MAG TPA: DUF5668 domain-containing protein [Thermoanaerobaculia bacterium]|nr:DUF5668 domain-containing protein [Thermoanaerobaculia bacterium]